MPVDSLSATFPGLLPLTPGSDLIDDSGGDDKSWTSLRDDEPALILDVTTQHVIVTQSNIVRKGKEDTLCQSIYNFTYPYIMRMYVFFRKHF